MKNLTESSKLEKNENKLTLNFSNCEILNLEDMKSICGGYGEDNGGGNIITIPK
jgi:hypothetical protein